MVLSQFMKITISENTVHGELNINIYYFTKNILENRASWPERKSLFMMKKKLIARHENIFYHPLRGTRNPRGNS